MKKSEIVTENFWHESMMNSSNKRGIYRLYFEGYEQFNFIGSTYNNSLKIDIAEHRNAFWKEFLGLYPKAQNKWYPWFINYQKYTKLNTFEKADQLQYYTIKRAERLYKFLNNKLLWAENFKYIKMLYFMELKNLSINDLRCEILIENDEYKHSKQELEKYIEKYDLLINGFDPIEVSLMMHPIQDDETKAKHLETLKRWDDIFNNRIIVDDEFTKWNVSINYYQFFKENCQNEMARKAWLKGIFPAQEERLLELFKNIRNVIFFEDPFYKKRFIRFCKKNLAKNNLIEPSQMSNSIKYFMNQNERYYTNNLDPFLGIWKLGSELLPYEMLDQHTSRTDYINYDADLIAINHFKNYGDAFKMFEKDPCKNIKGLIKYKQLFNMDIKEKQDTKKRIEKFDIDNVTSLVLATIRKYSNTKSVTVENAIIYLEEKLPGNEIDKRTAICTLTHLLWSKHGMMFLLMSESEQF